MKTEKKKKKGKNSDREYQAWQIRIPGQCMTVDQEDQKTSQWRSCRYIIHRGFYTRATPPSTPYSPVVYPNAYLPTWGRYLSSLLQADHWLVGLWSDSALDIYLMHPTERGTAVDGFRPDMTVHLPWSRTLHLSGSVLSALDRQICWYILTCIYINS